MLMGVLRLSPRLLKIPLTLALCCPPGIAQNADAKSLFEQGNAAMRRGDAAGAVQDFQEFLRLEPGSAEGYFNCGLALQAAGQLQEALTALHKAASLQPSLRGVRLFTGIVN